MTGVGSVYGEALYTLAREEGLSQAILQQLKVLDSCFAAEPDFLRLLGAPNLPKAERCQILDDSFRGKVEAYVLNFLKILTEKGYMRYFSDCVKAYRELYNQDTLHDARSVFVPFCVPIIWLYSPVCTVPCTTPGI